MEALQNKLYGHDGPGTPYAGRLKSVRTHKKIAHTCDLRNGQRWVSCFHERRRGAPWKSFDREGLHDPAKFMQGLLWKFELIGAVLYWQNSHGKKKKAYPIDPLIVSDFTLLLFTIDLPAYGQDRESHRGFIGAQLADDSV